LLYHDRVSGIMTLSKPEAAGENLSEDDLALVFNLAGQTAVAIENSKLNRDIEKTYFETISALDLAVDAKDEYSRGHLDRVADYALMIGKRDGFPHQPMVPHNVVLSLIGTGLLWVGWFGFNAGSALKAGSDAGMTMLATHLAAATATCVWIAIEWIKYGKPSLVGAVTGAVAGLATITPASGYVGPLGAVFLGAAGGAVCYGAVLVVKRMWKVDDALDVLGVHGVGGALGSLLVPFAAGLGIGGVALARPVWAQFGVQVEAVIATGVWSVVATFLIIKLVKAAAGWRIDREQEIQGLDFSSHGETGYNMNG